MDSSQIPREKLRQLVEQRDLQALAETVVACFGAEIGTIHSFDQQTGLLHLLVSVGPIPEPVKQMIGTIPLGKGIAGQAAQRREAVSVCNIQTDSSGVVRPGAKATGAQGALCVPVLCGDLVLGTLGIGMKTERIFSEAETSALVEISQLLAPALQKA